MRDDFSISHSLAIRRLRRARVSACDAQKKVSRWIELDVRWLRSRRQTVSEGIVPFGYCRPTIERLGQSTSQLLFVVIRLYDLGGTEWLSQGGLEEGSILVSRRIIAFLW